MSNSAPKHLENSQRCCFFSFVYVGTHQHGERPGCWGRPAIWTSSLLPLTSRVPAAQARSGWTREREVKGLSALPHYKLIPTLAARQIRKDQLGMCFPAISTTEKTRANRERVKNPEKNDPGWRRGHYHAFASLLSRHGVRLINGDRACKVITGLLLRLSGA